jgi:hypothetical protein
MNVATPTQIDRHQEVTMINYRYGLAALATLALAGTTLGPAAPAFAKPNVVSVTKTTTYTKKPGAWCSDRSGDYPDGTTISTTTKFDDGSSVTVSKECRNGTWFDLRSSGQTMVTGVTSPSGYAVAP